MVTLGYGVVLQLAMLISLISLSLFLLLMSLHVLCVKAKIFPRFAKLKLRYITLVVAVVCVLSFVVIARIGQVTAKRHVLFISEGLKNSTRLRIHNSFARSGPYIREEIPTTDKKVIEEVHDIMTNAKYEAIYVPGILMRGGAFATGDNVVVRMYNDEAQIGRFSLIGNILIVGSQDFLYESSDEFVMNKIRKAVKAGGVW